MNDTIFFTDASAREQRLVTARLKGTLLFSEAPLATVMPDQLKNVTVIAPFIHSAVTATTLAAMPNLKLIATKSTGYDHIDLKACAERGITVCNVPFYGENTVAEHALALMLTISRRIVPSVERTRHGDFTCAGLTGFDLKGKTLGVIGTGHIGTHLIRYAAALGMRILAFSKVQDAKAAQELGFAYAPFDRVLAESDVISIHVPLLPDTTHLLDDAAFKKMKKGVIIINTARGGIIDTMALVRALQSGIVGGAGLDVLEEEADLIAEHNHLDASTNDAALKTLLADHVLLGLDNVVITPHNAFNSSEAIERILMTTIDNVAAFLAGKPQNVVH